MARVVKVKNHTARRNEILDVALKLVYSKGYGRMTVQDILDELMISKGAFYHYFDSKAAVLEALVERMVVEQVEPRVLAIVQDPHLTALEKLQQYFDTSVRWKTANKSFIMQLVKVWYSDENALARQKMMAKMVKHVMPWFMEIIHQGIREAVFSTPYPDYAGQVNISLIQSLGDTFARMLISEGAQPDNDLQHAENILAAYNDVLERVLGAPKGSIHLMDAEMLREWFSPNDTRPVQGKAFTEKAALPSSGNP